ncbi:MAG: transglycosylase SLT domain-containing protein [Clostridium sp.]|nr:transglycosylase SLT domain-containing protein [Clostridium sp.]
MVLLWPGCKPASGGGEAGHALPDTLRVATLYSPASYFIYRDQQMGYDYSLVHAMAKEKGLQVDLSVAASLGDAIEMLDSGLVDLVAYEVPLTSHFKQRVIHCGPVNETSQVLVQPNVKGRITDVTQLVGRDVYVEAGSKYEQRIENLNEELGGGINIHLVDRDTLITEDLIAMVSAGEIPLTLVDSDIARINKTYYPDLDITMPVSFPQRSAWAVSRGSQWLADSIDAWISQDLPRRENAMLLKQYFEQSRSLPEGYKLDAANGRISRYDEIFKRYAPDCGWDWRMLAAMAFTESRFDPNVRSWAGARGLMQVIPQTAGQFQVTPEQLDDPATSVSVATRVIKKLDKIFAERVPNPQERIKFILAAYNAGPGHVLDAIAIAKKTGRDPQIWNGNVAEGMLLKSNPEYYRDPDVKFGYYRGRETFAYVSEIMDFYSKTIQKIKL